MIRKLLLPLIAIAALSACETVEGMGQDVENTGEAISSEANETQAEM